MENTESYNELVDEIRATCRDFEEDLTDGDIEDALTVVKEEYQ